MTIYDIAKKAGVSASTVSRVINDKPGVGEATKERIRELLKEYNYSPNEAARGLVTQSSKIVGILIEDIRISHHTESAYIIEQEMTKRGYTCITLSTGMTSVRKAEYIKILEQRRVDGAILIGSMFGTLEVEKSIKEHLPDVPIVLVNGSLNLSNVRGILVDEERGVEECVDLLVNKGCRNLAFAVDSITPSNNGKMQGFKKGLGKHGLGDYEEFIYYATDGDTAPEHTIERGRQVTKEIIMKYPEVNGIIYSIDLLAVGGLQMCYETGIAVPDQIAVIGVDNSLYGKVCTPKLTTLDNKLVEVCQNASRILLEAFEGKTMLHEMKLSTDIIQREST
ncbi:MAG: LacI family transcriptional regulator [Hungatella sp.]|jgi:LacI family transcriptional regulator|uniref:substrate-binding domain-containing protein n=1 Tax=Clostridium sp. NkU-1 TaxID=1095009 RepID=UPI0006D14E41|nr:LacI family transcriptional regulator [Hungatella sp.]